MNAPIDFYQVSPRELVSTSINSAADLLALAHHLIPGDRIDLFFAVAASKPDVAFKAFVTILGNYSDLTYRALALRGLGRIFHEPTLQEMRGCQTEFSQELVKFLAQEVTGQGKTSNDLTRWAAAEAITYIDYPPYIFQRSALGGLTEPPERIAREIIDKKLEQVISLRKRLNTISFEAERIRKSVEYERLIEFWVFGPIERLYQQGWFSEQDLENIFSQLGLRGLEIALQPNSARNVKKEAYKFLKAECDRYLSDRNRWTAEGLQRFLLESAQNFDSVEEFAKILTIHRSQYEDESYSLNAWTQDRINQYLEKTREHIYVLENFSVRFSSICSLPILKDLVQSNTDNLDNIERLLENKRSREKSAKNTLKLLKQFQSQISEEINLTLRTLIEFPELYAFMQKTLARPESWEIDTEQKCRTYLNSMHLSIQKNIDYFFTNKIENIQKKS